MDFELAGDDPTFDLPSPITESAASPAPHSATLLSNGATTRRRKGLPVHRCRFPDWSPASVTALAITPDSFDAGLLGLGGHSAERGVLAVGRANGDVELMVWGGHQGWISWRVSAPFRAPASQSASRLTQGSASADSPFVFPASERAELAQADVSLVASRLYAPDDALADRSGSVRGRRRRSRS